ncbi:hypothetical protein OCH239_05545 [Roseivivax halodurans JCM 10272]|uniref:Uncharacterized protein n=1 Tax=Roseivivax halodurans JCM 10272 TaxID=1449350 RepID=X7EFU6_9RHOB|nr:hypothetical protein [Roseivivax halodurans]ETX14106.1 hypothetical protein OCH239_05545 [Roseivivax halodurans JCM 10272]
MSERPEPPPRSAPLVFLERRSYRRRRMRDAARLLPVLGLFAWAIPLLWPQGEDGSPSVSGALIYVFTVWVVLVAVGAVLSVLTGDGDEPGAEDRSEGGGA